MPYTLEIESQLRRSPASLTDLLHKKWWGREINGTEMNKIMHHLYETLYDGKSPKDMKAIHNYWKYSYHGHKAMKISNFIQHFKIQPHEECSDKTLLVLVNVGVQNYNARTAI